MEEFDPLNPAERELAAALKSLSPAAAAIDPVAAAFAAGQTAARRREHWWQGAAALSLALCGMAWLSPAVRSNHPATPGDHLIPIVASVPDQPLPAMSQDSVICLRQAVLERGLDGLPHTHVPSSEPVNLHDMY